MSWAGSWKPGRAAEALLAFVGSGVRIAAHGACLIVDVGRRMVRRVAVVDRRSARRQVEVEVCLVDETRWAPGCRLPSTGPCSPRRCRLRPRPRSRRRTACRRSRSPCDIPYPDGTSAIQFSARHGRRLGRGRPHGRGPCRWGVTPRSSVELSRARPTACSQASCEKVCASSLTSARIGVRRGLSRRRAAGDSRRTTRACPPGWGDVPENEISRRPAARARRRNRARNGRRDPSRVDDHRVDATRLESLQARPS